VATKYLQQFPGLFSICTLASGRDRALCRFVGSLQHIFNELQYEMTRKIAEGGMGLVYEAVQLGAGNFRKVVAVKLIREEYSAIAEFKNNFIGEARFTVIGGKDEYLSPEQASYEVTDARADIFPLGIVLTEILLGRNLFRSVDRAQSRRNILSMPIPNFATLRADIEPALETIIQRCLQRDRDQRYQSSLDVLTDLEMYLYSDRYGPTNEKLGVYLKEIFGVRDPVVPAPSLRTQI
jgi:hypothetical protein